MKWGTEFLYMIWSQKPIDSLLFMQHSVHAARKELEWAHSRDTVTLRRDQQTASVLTSELNSLYRLRGAQGSGTVQSAYCMKTRALNTRRSIFIVIPCNRTGYRGYWTDCLHTCLFCSNFFFFTILKLILHTLKILKIPLKLQHVSVLTGPSSGSTSNLAKVTTVYCFTLYTYIGAVETCMSFRVVKRKFWNKRDTCANSWSNNLYI